jgi:hypothetical protein
LNAGQIIGKGGNGGDGANALNLDGFTCIVQPPSDGGNGGDGIELTTDAVIDNAFGLIAGGGGGASGLQAFCLPDDTPVAGAGGGGGQGNSPGFGGDGGSAETQSGTTLAADGDDATINKAGGAGGTLGKSGLSNAPASGGDAGKAIKTNGNTVTITAGNNSEQLKGAVV